MEPKYDHRAIEEKIYHRWEESGAFTPQINPQKKPFTILLPLPNANDPMHMGHALFTVGDILARYHRMLGDPTLWLPGADHAGIETQYVYEKHLAKEGKSRFDFDRETLFKMVWGFVEKNRELNKNQLKRLGFSLDWTRYHYSLEPQIVENVLATFRKLYHDKLLYRGQRLVNYCPRCGTAFSELEVDYQERSDFLYYLNYGPVSVATTRPETIFADTAVAINPKDKRYLKLPGQQATIPLLNLTIPIITDPAIDIKFGSGALKVTPGHDPLDFEIGSRHHLPVISIVDRAGRLDFSDPRFNGLREKAILETLSGLKIPAAREKILELLVKSGALIKKEPLTHAVGICYRCGTVIEPLLLPQWFVKTKSLAEPAIAAIKTGKTKIVPQKRFAKMYFDWMENIKDWNISRQIVWGPRIPVWYCLDCNAEIQIGFISSRGEKVSGPYRVLKENYPFAEISRGLQTLIAPQDAVYQLEPGPCQKCHSEQTLQETDTFDTWFLSGQWPLTTLGYNVAHPEESSGDFEYFYPTSVLDTLWDILFFWVGRMMMFGLYLTGEAPFRVIHLHARVVDRTGQKMSKSRGNVIDPIIMVDKYGADALRMALTAGVTPGGDIALSEEKIIGYRNFANKIWNMGRFLSSDKIKKDLTAKSPGDAALELLVKNLVRQTTDYLRTYRFGQAAEELYRVTWHELADKYIEEYKKGLLSYSVLKNSYLTILKLLHPFIPFVTEAVWDQFSPEKLLISTSWPPIHRTDKI